MKAKIYWILFRFDVLQTEKWGYKWISQKTRNSTSEIRFNERKLNWLELFGCLFLLEDSNEGVGETERGDGDNDDYDEDAVSVDGICLEAKEVVQYSSDESSSTDEEEEFRDDADDADYGTVKGKGTWINLSEFLFFAIVQKDLMRKKKGLRSLLFDFILQLLQDWLGK